MTGNTSATGDTHHTGDQGDGTREEESLRIPLVEESLEARVVEREQGRLRLHRRVETEPVETQVTLHHDRYNVAHLPVNEFVAERQDPWYEGTTLMVPVYDEVAVTETRLRLREIIRLERQDASETVDVRDTVRREVIEIEEIPEP